MPEQAPRAEQAIALVDPEVIPGLRVEGQGEVDLRPVLREMGLDEGPGFSAARACATSICAGVEVMAKRGVIATWARPRPSQAPKSAFVSS